ncbi:MAG: VTT domain-containing protein [Proteobacteria bacterium]|nr:VTT domain-containing protein [Pseudomonadota bacterium]
MFYVYHEGQWRQIIGFYKFFLDPRKLRVFIASFGPFAACVFVLVQALQVIVAPVPGELTGVVGGFLFGNTSGVILSTIGLAIGSLFAFGITRLFGMGFVEKIVKKEYIDKFNFFITHRGLNITFILFLIPGFPKDTLCYLLGLTHIRLVDFLFMNIFGRLPGTLMLTLQGSALKDGRYQTFFWLLAVSIAFTVVLYFTRNYIIQAFSATIHKLLGKKKDNEDKTDSVNNKK